MFFWMCVVVRDIIYSRGGFEIGSPSNDSTGAKDMAMDVAQNKHGRKQFT